MAEANAANIAMNGTDSGMNDIIVETAFRWYEDDGRMSDKAIGLMLAMMSSLFIGISFIVTKRALIQSNHRGMLPPGPA